MVFLSTFLTTAIKMIVLMAVIVLAVFCGHKLRDRKDAKDALNASEAVENDSK